MFEPSHNPIIEKRKLRDECKLTIILISNKNLMFLKPI